MGLALTTLSPAQKATAKTWLEANTSGIESARAAVANALVAPDYFVWQSKADKSVVDGQINKANYTPTDAVPVSPSTDMTYQNRALSCQLKQTNAQWLTQGTNTIDAQILGVRQNFKDCLMAIPSGASGANLDAGWGVPATPGNVRTALMRKITNFEKLFVTATGVSNGPGNVVADARGANTNPDLLGIGSDGKPIEFKLTDQDVSDLLLGL